MTTACSAQCSCEMPLMEMTERLLEMAQPTTNDKRQENYCNYLNIALSHFGGERAILVGSTQEGTKLRLRKDNGDFDFLVISEVDIPVECLEHVDVIPCFVHINGITLHEAFPEVELINGKYIPSSLLSECRPEAFKLSRRILQIILRPEIFQNNDISIFTDSKIKAGMALDTSTFERSDALSQIVGEIERDYEHILTQFTGGTQNPSLDQAKTIVGKVVDILHDLKENDKSKIVPMMYQQFGAIIDALSEKVISSKPDLDLKINASDFKSTSNIDESNNSTGNLSCTGTAQHDNEVQQNSTVEEVLKQRRQIPAKGNELQTGDRADGNETMVLKRLTKSHNDYIPVFRLSGKLFFLENWRERRRLWPSKEIVEDIFHSDVFVAAKPATIRPDKAKDFSLSFNIAELKLAKAMSLVQKKVVLILKALKQSVLVEFSDIVSSFHWKTAVYWVSEITDPARFVDTEKEIISFLMTVLEYMTDCLCKQELQHYFISANLFAGISVEKAFEIVAKLVEILEDPQHSLFQYFDNELHDLIKAENKIIPTKHMKSIVSTLTDPTQQSKIQGLISLVGEIEKQEIQTPDLNAVVLDIVLNSLPFLKEEMERDESSESGVDEKVPATLDEVFNSVYSYLMVSSNDKDAIKTTRKQLLNDLLSLDPRHRKK